ncbi:hypothetical protein BJ138DRAFT_826358 [Hygrophoropsis aurantiaca]|uniref:Uncharacterized protein n=1 Tax=Hygrophoropsis aurantiaca TaxID=72124 RepID=A0ACB8ARB7_9AGAM|nr:hypothetical protein BJ138DRAFT_826358 [Hygrophoropsis aurantiaca]
MLTTPFPRPNPSNSPPKPPLPVQSLDINLNFGPPALGDMFNTPFEFGEAASSTNSAGASTKPRSFDFVFPSSQVQTRSHQDDANGSGSGYSYQRYTPPRFLGGRPHIHTAYYSARSEFEPELEPQNEAEVEPLNYTPYYTAQSSPEPETPTPRPPSPVPTMDFSMISPPNSPTFHSFADAQRTPPRVRPGITRLWESFASPGGPLRSKSRDNLKIPNVSGIGRSKSPPTMHIKSSSSTGKWTGSPVGKLKEKRRAKARKRSLAYVVSLDLDLDYGAMPPLDGEEGELIAIGGDYIWETDQSRSPSPTPSLSQTPTPIAEYSDPLIAVHSKQVHTLPPELFLHILSFLPLRSVLAASAVCLRWRVLAMDNAVWWELWKRKEQLICPGSVVMLMVVMLIEKGRWNEISGMKACISTAGWYLESIAVGWC